MPACCLFFVGSLYTRKKMSSQYFTDEQGRYLTLGCINNMKNAEHVNVFFIQTDIEAVFIPREVVQDGLSTNAEKFTKKIYFKQQKNVRVDYSLNLTAEEKSIRLESNALRDPMGRVGRSLGTAGPDTGSRGLGTGRGSTGARYRASVLGNGTKNLTNKNICPILFKILLKNR